MTLIPVLAALLLSPTAHFSPGGPVFTYDRESVPVTARAASVPIELGGSTAVVLKVRGLLPRHEYGAHVHVNACGADPAAAGPHTQYRADPVKPSVDPAYANPRNEVWLDFTTDRRGDAVAIAHVPWKLSSRSAKSVVLHAEHTHTDPGHAGTAGARLACLPLGR